jgi:hypothetical protein
MLMLLSLSSVSSKTPATRKAARPSDETVNLDNKLEISLSPFVTHQVGRKKSCTLTARGSAIVTARTLRRLR